MCGNILQTWRGAFKLTADHALFIARVHPSRRKSATLDYWAGRIAVFVIWYFIYLLFSRYTIASKPLYLEDSCVAFDVDLTPTRYFYGFFAAFGILVWNFILKGDVMNDSRLLILPNALPPRLPIIAHSQVFWRDYYREPAERAHIRLETLTDAAQTVANDAGLTRYWLRPWGPPIVYVSSPTSIRDVFMLEEFVEVHIGGRACRYLPRTLWSCGYGHPMNLLTTILIKPEVLQTEANIYVKCSNNLVRTVVESPKNDYIDLVAVAGNVILDAVGELALGPDFSPIKLLREQFNVAVDGAAAILSAPPPSFPLPSWLWKKISSEGRSIVSATYNIEKYVEAEIGRRRRRIESSESVTPTCLADHMLLKYPGATDNEITEDIAALMIQRYSVLVTGVVWSIREIISLKSTNTINAIIKQGERAIQEYSASDNSQSGVERLDLSMPTLERCVKESLRLHPPVPSFAPLILLKNVKLGGYVVKAKSEIRIMPFMVQRSAKYWKNDTELMFKEDRWTYHSCQGRRPFTSCPFGAGILKCESPESIRKGIQYICYGLLSECKLSIVSNGKIFSDRSSILLPTDGLIVEK